MKAAQRNRSWIMVLILILGFQAGFCQAVGTAITYQGKLDVSGELGNGQFDFTFEVFSDALATTSVGGPILVDDLDVTAGLFTASLDFGAGVFIGADRWLKISVRDGASVGAYTALLPAQKVTATPYALFAANSGLDASSLCSFDPMINMLCSGTANPDKMILAHSAAFPNWGMAYKDVGDDFEFLANGVPAMQIGLSEKELRLLNGTNATLTLYGAMNRGGGIGGAADFLNSNGNKTIEINGQDALGFGVGSIRTFNDGGFETFELLSGNSVAGRLQIFGGEGLGSANSIVLSGSTSGGSTLSMYEDAGIRTILMDADAGGGEITLYDDADGSLSVRLEDSAGGQLNLYNDSGNIRAILDGDSGDGGLMWLYNAAGNITVVIDAESGGGAYVGLDNAAGSTRITLDGEDGTGAGQIIVDDANGRGTIQLIGDESGSGPGPELNLYDSAGTRTIELDGEVGTLGGGFLRLYNSSGVGTITLDSDVAGDGRITTQELVITGGSDLSEQFDVADAQHKPQPGMVVCIDAEHPGKLQVSTTTYDRKVAGIISGAGGVETGMMMGHAGTIADGDYPVALTGRVYCKCTTANGTIEPGDLLTTSAVFGHAMKVTDYAHSQGAIIGKAMTALDKESGLVLVLVSLQ